jgi:hypothetical protein
VHVVVAIISVLVFLTMAGLFVVGDMELDFTSHNRLAMMHTGCVACHSRSASSILPHTRDALQPISLGYARNAGWSCRPSHCGCS